MYRYYLMLAYDGVILSSTMVVDDRNRRIFVLIDWSFSCRLWQRARILAQPCNWIESSAARQLLLLANFGKSYMPVAFSSIALFSRTSEKVEAGRLSIFYLQPSKYSRAIFVNKSPVHALDAYH